MTSTQHAPTKKPTGRKRSDATASQTTPPMQQDPVWKKAQLGLAKVGAPMPEVENKVGAWTEDTTERGYDVAEDGSVNGTTYERKTGAGAGAKRSTKTEHHVFDGTTTTDYESETEGLAGVEVAATMLGKHTSQEISAGIETLARAGAFGEAKCKGAIKRHMMSAGYEAEASGGAGVEARLKAEAKIDRTGAIPALLATLDAGIKAGVWAEGKFTGTATLGPVGATVLAEVNGLIGGEATITGKLFASLEEGIGGELEAGAMVGAKGSASGSVEVGIPGKVGIELGGSVEAMAGAEAKLEAGVTISLKGVSAKFKAEAFAGAKASATGKASIKLMGKTILAAEGTVEVSAGAGGTAEGEFTFLNGKLKISANLAATLGIGLGASGDIEIDLGTLGTIIYAKLYEIQKSSSDPVVKDVSPDFKREPLKDPAEAAKKHQIGYDAVYESFLAYARKKTMQGKGVAAAPQFGPGTNRDNEGIKRERVQAIIDDVSPLLRADMAYLETDEGIQKAALDAFGGQLSGVIVDHGKIRSWTPTDRATAIESREKLAAEEKMRVVRDPFLDELHGYCRKKMTEGAHGVKESVVQGIIDKHYKKLQATFTASASEPDEVVAWVAEEMKARYLSDFAVKNGKITSFVVDEAKTKQVKDEAAGQLADAALGTALQQLDAGLTGYLNGVLGKKDGSVDGASITKVISKAMAKVSAQLSKPEVAEAVKLKVMTRLGDVVQGIEIKDGVVTALVLKDGGVAAARTKRDADAAEAAKQACADKFGRALVAYREHKTAKGTNGLKPVKVQGLLDTALKTEAAWKTSGDADAALMGAATTSLGESLKGVSIVNGVVKMFDFDNAGLAEDKKFRKENGTARLGGEEDDNQRRSMVTAGVRGPLKALCDSFRAAAEKDPTARLDKSKLQGILDKGVKGIRADANTPAGNEALEDALKLYLPMIKDVTVENLQITTLVVNEGMWVGKAAQKTSDTARAAIKSELKKKKGSMTAALANEIIAKHKAKLSSLPADELDMVLQLDIVEALLAVLQSNDPVTVSGGTVTKLLLKAKK
ncbi:hypothetical protein ABFT23_04565 [Nocardioides sp. C4-1]|uniref:hypothetical protein n=1 Tax=Nocardioides sp. C4-1 TaxID=3151851 RepID=UPI0032652879